MKTGNNPSHPNFEPGGPNRTVTGSKRVVLNRQDNVCRFSRLRLFVQASAGMYRHWSGGTDMRRYVEFKMQVIVDDSKIEDVTTALQQLSHSDELDLGEVSVKHEVHGEVQVNEHGYAVRWVD